MNIGLYVLPVIPKDCAMYFAQTNIVTYRQRMVPFEVTMLLYETPFHGGFYVL